MSECNHTVLYVEDEDRDRNNIAQYLRYRYKDVIEATNGTDAYGLFENNDIDFIITDINMPKMDGLELIRKIRQIDVNIPIIVLSAYSDKDKLMQAMKLNLVDYLVKPVSRLNLKQAIDNALIRIEKTTKIDMSAYNELLESVIIFDEQNNILDCNSATLSMFGYESKDDVIGLSAYAMTLEKENTKIDKAKNSITHINGEIYLLKKDKTVFVAKTKSKTTIINFKKLRIVSIVDLSTTIKEYSVDILTKLQTRRTLEFEFNNMVSKCYIENETACAMFLDIDNFKYINDTFGHQEGDEAIKKISKILLNGVRGSDLVVRWGGDEFMVLLLNTSISHARNIAENIRKNVSKINIGDGVNMACSIGIDSIKYEDTLSDVTSRIDKALRNAKRGSKDCVVEYTLVK